MFFFELILALLIAAVLAAVLAYPLDRRGPGPWDGLLFFFLILFLAAWAGGLWLTPIGPFAWGTPWLAFIMVGVVIALILAAGAPPRRRLPSQPSVEDVSAPEAIVLTLGAFFYLALLALLIAVAVYYVLAI